VKVPAPAAPAAGPSVCGQGYSPTFKSMMRCLQSSIVRKCRGATFARGASPAPRKPRQLKVEVKRQVTREEGEGPEEFAVRTYVLLPLFLLMRCHSITACDKRVNAAVQPPSRRQCPSCTCCNCAARPRFCKCTLRNLSGLSLMNSCAQGCGSGWQCLPSRWGLIATYPDRIWHAGNNQRVHVIRQNRRWARIKADVVADVAQPLSS
jgi:hypothetical protein